MTATRQFPDLDMQESLATRNALHAYSRVLGDWLKSCRRKRKHWWHASLRPSLTGLTTGVVHAGIDFELEIDLQDSRLLGHTAQGGQFSEELDGQSAAELAEVIGDFQTVNGIDASLVPSGKSPGGEQFAGYAATHARSIGRAFNAVYAAMSEFRSGIPEETSPIQVWPHHFDLSMLWLPGEKIEGQDPENEEYSDKQMNFGFTFGDEGIREPYLYVTAYPTPDGFPKLELAAGTTWQTEGFNGAVLLYKTLIENKDPNGYLQELWTTLLSAGRGQMLGV